MPARRGYTDWVKRGEQKEQRLEGSVGEGHPGAEAEGSYKSGSLNRTISKL